MRTLKQQFLSKTEIEDYISRLICRKTDLCYHVEPNNPPIMSIYCPYSSAC